jgi:hypothetical protein
MGHRLRDRLPVLKLNPSPDFLERCFWHFLRMLELREMQDVRDELVKRPPAAFDEDLLHEVESVQAEVMILRDRVNADENDLAEEAQAFRSPSGGRVPVAGLAA